MEQDDQVLLSMLLFVTMIDCNIHSTTGGASIACGVSTHKRHAHQKHSQEPIVDSMASRILCVDNAVSRCW